ncbi:MAG TPA: hypothetical protein VF062_04255 [Candidatus Limnocylindrales bacterium]
MQHLTDDLIRAVMETRLAEARDARRAAIVFRERRRARRAEDRTRPTRMRLARGVLGTTEAG